MLPSYIKLPCVEIVNDKLTNISQKESASNPVSFVAIKQQQQKKTNKQKSNNNNHGKNNRFETDAFVDETGLI